LLLAQNGHFEEAEKVQRRFIRDAENAAVPNPGGLAILYRHLAGVLAATGRSGEAEEKLHKVVDLQTKLLAQSPTNAVHRNNLATSHHYLANLLRDTGSSVTAEESYLEALAHQEPLTALFPRNADYQLELARIQSDRGNWLTSTGRSSEAQEAFQKALQGFQLALQLSPQRHDLLYHLARFLANCPDPQFRDAGRAVDLAQKAAGQAPQAWYCWRALGQALYRTGDWKASVAALEVSMKFYAGGNASDWFFLAMAHWQLGDHPRARQWFDQAVKWMTQYQPMNEELDRFRAEAEAVIHK
jgi:tetratricopeptide (TPR) repeat protein